MVSQVLVNSRYGSFAPLSPTKHQLLCGNSEAGILRTSGLQTNTQFCQGSMMVINEDNEAETIEHRFQSLFFETKNAMIDNRFRAIVDRIDCFRMPAGISPGFRDFWTWFSAWFLDNHQQLSFERKKMGRDKGRGHL
ncbi:hypothetical protein Ddc_18758 [Ditylenchus destructor]|nr:hypothetical protein Ddc_18758 [Ditylenchus destructor]